MYLTQGCLISEAAEFRFLETHCACRFLLVGKSRFAFLAVRTLTIPNVCTIRAIDAATLTTAQLINFLAVVVPRQLCLSNYDLTSIGHMPDFCCSS